MGKVKVVKSSEGRKSLQTIDKKNEGHVELKKVLGLSDGVALIIGGMIGAGIFVAPKGVLLHSGSIGLALILWLVCGLTSLMGALCYAELGTMIPKSGGEYAYIKTAFGGLPAFLFIWVSMSVLAPAANAILSLTFSHYLLQPFFSDSGPPELAIRLISATVIVLLIGVNCYNAEWGARLQTIFTTMKVSAVVLIIVAGLVLLCMGKTENLKNPFEGTNKDPSQIALAVYSGLFSFSGWNYLNFVVEELKDPFKNLPRAIIISLPLVTAIFTLANLAYFIVLSKTEILNSSAVAVTFSKEVFGVMSFIMSLLVAWSVFGGLNGAIYGPSRVIFAAARDGQLPKALSIVNADTFTPIPAILLLGLMSLSMLFVEDVYTLINYATFSEALFLGMSVFALLWLRFKDPDAVRPIKVPIIYPIIFSATTVFLIVVSVAICPASEICVAVLIILSGIPVYLIFIMWENKPKFLGALNDALYQYSATLFNGVHADSPKND